MPFTVNRDNIKPGTLVFKWHDSGAFGPKPMYAEVVRVNRVTATIKWLRTGLVMRLPFHHLEIETDPETMLRELAEEGDIRNTNAPRDAER